MPEQQKRNIFKYFDGKQDAYADPLAVYRGFMGYFSGDPDPVLQAARAKPRPDGTPEPPADRMARLEAERDLAACARECLDMAPWDRTTGEGATEEDCLKALYAWLEWLEGNAGTAAKSPT
jgi:hypothetical protein